MGVGWAERSDAQRQAEISAHPIVMAIPDLMNDASVRARGLSVTRHHEELGLITTTAPGVRLSRTPVVMGRPAPKPGSDAASVLNEIGLLDELDRLISDGVIAVDGVKAGC